MSMNTYFDDDDGDGDDDDDDDNDNKEEVKVEVGQWMNENNFDDNFV